MKRLLIHGYGKSLDISEPRIPQNGGFYIFDDELASGSARAFLWSVPWSRSWFRPWNPIAQFRLYLSEKRASQDREVFDRLGDEIAQYQPNQIVCHSMGSQLFLHFVQERGMPECISQVVFVQSDVRATYTFAQFTSVEWVNIWCWWDPTLWISSLINAQFRAGLVGFQDPSVRNVFFRLRVGPNLHKDVWRDSRLYEWINSQL